MNKNILVITGGSYIAGTEIVTLDVLVGLKNLGWHLYCIISGWSNNCFASRLDKLGIPYSTFKLGWYYVKKVTWSVDSLIHYPQAVIKFLYLKNKHPHKFIYLTSYRQLILLYPFLKKNIIYHVHDANSFSRQSTFFLKIADKKILKYIAVSNFIKNDLLKCGIPFSKIEVIYNSVNPEQFNTFNKKVFDPNKIVLGIVGQVIPRKGHEEVIKALYLLINKGYQNVILHIVGSGDIKFIKSLKETIINYKIENHVIWKGFLEEKEDIYRNIDILLAPTRNEEPFGMIAIEANMFSIPVIASKRGGLMEIIENNYNGYLVEDEVDNESDLFNKIEILLKNTGLIATFGFNGRKKVIEQFSTAEMVNKLSACFNNL